MMTTKTVLMVISMFVPNGDTLREEWRTDPKAVSADVCLSMSQLAMGGKYGVFVVNCKPSSIAETQAQEPGR